MDQLNGLSTALDPSRDADDCLTFDDVAAKLKIGRSTVPRLLRRYKIPVAKLAHNTQRLTQANYRRLLAELHGKPPERTT